MGEGADIGRTVNVSVVIMLERLTGANVAGPPNVTRVWSGVADIVKPQSVSGKWVRWVCVSMYVTSYSKFWLCYGYRCDCICLVTTKLLVQIGCMSSLV